MKLVEVISADHIMIPSFAVRNSMPRVASSEDFGGEQSGERGVWGGERSQ